MCTYVCTYGCAWVRQSEVSIRCPQQLLSPSLSFWIMFSHWTCSSHMLVDELASELYRSSCFCPGTADGSDCPHTLAFTLAQQAFGWLSLLSSPSIFNFVNFFSFSHSSVLLGTHSIFFILFFLNWSIYFLFYNLHLSTVFQWLSLFFLSSSFCILYPLGLWAHFK